MEPELPMPGIEPGPPGFRLIKDKTFLREDNSHIIVMSKSKKVPPRFELGSLDSKSRVLTITPWNPNFPCRELNPGRLGESQES
ncbi:hypothetical protein TNCV_2204311 [Trichonephila clavipes]|nr:hypothetical protein TNCV_2204311 [Trichonephila clavipes]